jgi:acyl carrier protein
VPNSEGLKEIWSKILELDEIPDEGNFVSLGGDSLDFIALVLNIEQKFGVRFSVDELAAALTLPAMTLAITEKSKGRQRSFESDTRSLIADTLSTWEGESIGDNELVKRISSSQNSVLYWCLQSEREFKRLSQLLEKTVNLHGLRSLNLLIKRTDENLAEVAELYADEIISLHRDHNTPLYIGGNCQGSTLMLWVAKALERKGMEINHFIMMEKFFDEPLAFPVTMLFGDKSERNLFRFGGLTLPYAKSRYPNLRGIYEVRGQHAQFFSDNNIDSLAVQIINAIRDAEKRTLRNRNFLRVNLKNLRVRTFATLAKKFH